MKNLNTGQSEKDNIIIFNRNDKAKKIKTKNRWPVNIPVFRAQSKTKYPDSQTIIKHNDCYICM